MDIQSELNTVTEEIVAARLEHMAAEEQRLTRKRAVEIIESRLTIERLRHMASPEACLLYTSRCV